MQTLSTAQAVVSMLELNGIDTLFCLPGVQNDPFFDALYDRTNAIRPIHARHEQACAAQNGIGVGAAISRGIARGGPMLIDCPVGELPDPWPLVALPRNRPHKA